MLITVSSHWRHVNSVKREWGFGKMPVIRLIVLIFYYSISCCVAYFNNIWGLSSTAIRRNIDIRFSITAFLLSTHYAEFANYTNVKKKRNVHWNQFLDVITSSQNGCTKPHSLLKIKPGGTNSSVCYSKHLFWAKRFLRVIFPLFIRTTSLLFFSISLLLSYFS